MFKGTPDLSMEVRLESYVKAHKLGKVYYIIDNVDFVDIDKYAVEFDEYFNGLRETRPVIQNRRVKCYKSSDLYNSMKKYLPKHEIVMSDDLETHKFDSHSTVFLVSSKFDGAIEEKIRKLSQNVKDSVIILISDLYQDVDGQTFDQYIKTLYTKNIKDIRLL